VPFEEGGLHHALQGRKVYVGVGPFGSGLRGRRNIGGSFLVSHFREGKEEWKFQRKEKLGKMATMVDNERIRKYVKGE
jgi:hypothetical protein